VARCLRRRAHADLAVPRAWARRSNRRASHDDRGRLCPPCGYPSNPSSTLP
jgi:hypothetical protein